MSISFISMASTEFMWKLEENLQKGKMDLTEKKKVFLGKKINKKCSLANAVNLLCK